MALCRSTEAGLLQQALPAHRVNERKRNDGPFIYKAREEINNVDNEVRSLVHVFFDFQVIQLVQDEEVDISITLRNKYRFDLEVTSLTLL
jgi:hypothetical protein